MASGGECSGAVIELARAGRRGYFALPAQGRGRGVLVLTDAGDEPAREICDRLAREAFVALAPNRGDSPQTNLANPGDSPQTNLSDRDGSAPGGDGVAGLLEALVADLFALEPVAGARIAVLGLGSGGALALRAAAASRRVGAVVILGGAPAAEGTELAAIAAPVLAVFAERDPAHPPARIAELRARLESAGLRAEVRVLPGVEADYFLPDRPEAFAAAAAAETWTWLLAFLRAEIP